MNILRTLCWAVYLGCSWTWCIGMFLPVILVSEFGNIAWFVFAIPNVIGAAAMGWTLARPGASETIVIEHRIACIAFSAVTAAFHLFFLYWMSSAGLIPITYSIIAVTVGICVGFIGRGRIGLDFLLAFLVFGVSLALLCKGMMHPVFGVPTASSPRAGTSAMLGLAAVSLFGFLLCPYLDLTFHRARRNAPPLAGKLAFAIGFGGVFLSMIILTLLYTGGFSKYKYDTGWFGSFSKAVFFTCVGLHMATQTGFTLAAHLRAMPRPRTSDWLIWIAAVVMVAGSIIAIRQQQWFDAQHSGLQMFRGALIYRLFMSFYGLIFPAYVWICIVPIRGKSPGASRWAIVTMSIAVLIAVPMFWRGFINEAMLWLIPGVAVTLIARLFVPNGAHLQRSFTGN